MEQPAMKLPVVKILLSAVLAPIVHWRRVLWFAIPLIVVEAIALWFQESLPTSEAPSVADVLPILALGVLSYGAWLLLAVACHRIFILGEGSMAGQKFMWWTSRETRFLGWAIGISLVAACLIFPFLLFIAPLASSPDQLGLQLAGLVLALPAVYVFTRLSLVLPATATDMTPNFAWAWQASRNNGIRLTLVVAVWPLLIQFLLALMPEVQSLVYNAILALAGIYIVVVEVAALSTSYRELVLVNPVPDIPVETS